jgi:hypothetical protein
MPKQNKYGYQPKQTSVPVTLPPEQHMANKRTRLASSHSVGTVIHSGGTRVGKFVTQDK